MSSQSLAEELPPTMGRRSRLRSSQAKHLNQSDSGQKPTYVYELLWACCYCNGGHSAMSVDSTPACPGCGWARCAHCPLEWVKRRIESGIARRGGGYMSNNTPCHPALEVDVQDVTPPEAKITTFSSQSKPGTNRAQEPVSTFPPLESVFNSPSSQSGEQMQTNFRSVDSAIVSDFSRESDLNFISIDEAQPYTLLSDSRIVGDFVHESTIHRRKKPDFEAHSPPTAKDIPIASFNLSPNSSIDTPMAQIFTPQQRSPDSDTETEVDSARLQNDRNEDAEISYEDHAMSVLESRLMAILDYDLDLVASVIPTVFYETRAALQADSQEGVTSVPSSRDTQSNRKGQGSSNAASSTKLSAMNATPSKTRSAKRSRSEDESEKPNQWPRRSFKKPQPLSGQQVRKFACHWHKKDPATYDSRICPKYKTCPAPSVRVGELRRIKDHFEYVHGPLYCECCFAPFEDAKLLVDHCSVRSCHKQHLSLVEGISSANWIAIESLVKAHRGLTGSDKEKHEFDRWYEIWDLLFPGVPRPSNPFAETASSPSAPHLPDFMSIEAAFQRIIDIDMDQGILRQDDHVHQRYLRAFREACHTYEINTNSGNASHPPSGGSPEATTSTSDSTSISEQQPSNGSLYPLDDSFVQPRAASVTSNGSGDMGIHLLDSQFEYIGNLGMEENREMLDPFSGFNLNLHTGFQDSSVFETNLEDPFHTSTMFSNNIGQELDGNALHDSLVSLLSSENDLSVATAPFKTKHDGSKPLQKP